MKLCDYFFIKYEDVCVLYFLLRCMDKKYMIYWEENNGGRFYICIIKV